MLLTKILGTYSKDQIDLQGSFQLNGAGAPTVFRDGTNCASAKKMFSVSRVSAGLYTIQFSTTDKYPIPKLPFIRAVVDQAAAPAAPVKVHVVKNSWNQSTRQFQVQIQTVTTAPAASDGDAGDRVTWFLRGSISSVGTDPA